MISAKVHQDDTKKLEIKTCQFNSNSKTLVKRNKIIIQSYNLLNHQ